MKKWTRLFALLLSLCLICTTGMSAMATELNSDSNVSGETENKTETTDDEEKEKEDNDTEKPVDKPQEDDKNEEVEKPYPLGTTEITENEPYVYKIRIFAGKQGSFIPGGIKISEGTTDGDDKTGTEGEKTGGEGETGTVTDENGEETVSGNDAGPAGMPVIEFTVDPAKYTGNPQIILNCDKYLQLSNDSKYYVMGIRESGRDNSMVGAVTINGDRDFVVAYGLRGKMVNYTVEYVDQATGEELAPSRTYEGKVGDKPVVAYLYVDGYRPQAYNLTKTLSEDESENVFRFEYSVATNPSDRVIGSDEEIVTIIDDVTGMIGGGQGGIIDEGTTVIGGGGAGAGGDAGAGEGGVTIGDEPTPLDAPQQLIDLDDEDVPLAGNNGGGLFGTEGNASILGIPIVVFIMIGLVMAGGLWYAFIYKKKKKEQEETKS